MSTLRTVLRSTVERAELQVCNYLSQPERWLASGLGCVVRRAGETDRQVKNRALKIARWVVYPFALGFLILVVIAMIVVPPLGSEAPLAVRVVTSPLFLLTSLSLMGLALVSRHARLRSCPRSREQS